MINYILYTDNQDYVVETKLYWVSSRYYSLELCRWISPDSIEYLDPESINGLNLYCYCGNDPIMYADPSGHLAVSIGLLISVGINVAISIVMEGIEDGKDGQFLNDKDLLDYFGAGLGGAISGMAGSATGAIALGVIASMVECIFSGDTSVNNMMTSIFSGAIGGLIGFGIGKVVNYGVSFVEAGVVKMVAKSTSNYQVNKFLTKIGVGTIKVGLKNLKRAYKTVCFFRK